MNQTSANSTIKKVEELLKQEKNISPALKLAIKVLLEFITLLMGSLNKNSHNSSKPPADDKKIELAAAIDKKVIKSPVVKMVM